MAVIIAQTEGEIRACWPVMAQLRPHLNESDFVAAVQRQVGEGFQLAYIRSGEKVGAVAGFRLMHSLGWGRFCYVDDLVTDEQTRSSGLGKELFDWLCEFARAENCQRLDLDSAVHRFGAHRFYLRNRMNITCHHFTLEL